MQRPNATTSRRKTRAKFRLTPKREEVLRTLSEFFCLRARDLAQILHQCEPTESDIRATRRTLQLLQDQGLVHAEEHFVPHSAQRRGRWMGTTIYIYGLTDKGAREYRGKTFDEHSSRTLDHELEISLFHIAIKRFCERQGLNLYWQQSDLKRGIHPDVLFKLIRDGQQLCFFLEIEKQHSKLDPMSVRHKKGILAKLARYAEYFDTDECRKDWNFSKFRVVIVQKDNARKPAARRQNLLTALSKKLPYRMFWITTDTLYKNDIGADIFLTPKDFEHSTVSFLQLWQSQADHVPREADCALTADVAVPLGLVKLKER